MELDLIDVAPPVEKVNTAADWRSTSTVAKFWKPYGDPAKGQVECGLCPRHCRPRNGQFGFCRVRGSVDGALHTFNYGKSVAATEEVVETEAVNHFSPGARILSLGNIGCMMSCDFCQNWETSQVKHLDPTVVRQYTPEEIVESCLSNGIGIISWTYNDPVVWHEFVVDTSRLAQRHGIKTLFKSAFYIEEEPVKELIDCIDIFSLSLKSMDPEFYRKITKAELEPMLERTKQIYASGRHLEISQLVITERNDGKEDIYKTVRWILDNLGDRTPLHFVAFHPAYKYMKVQRTPVESLYMAREIALQEGIKYLYLGNVYEDGAADTRCPSCSTTWVTRFGLNADVIGLNPDGSCAGCGVPSDIRFPFEGQQKRTPLADFVASNHSNFTWSTEANSIHVVLSGDSSNSANVRLVRGDGSSTYHRLGAGISRFIASRASDEEAGITVEWDGGADVRLMPVLDRAHFPVSESLEKNLAGYVKNRN